MNFKFYQMYDFYALFFIIYIFWLLFFKNIWHYRIEYYDDQASDLSSTVDHLDLKAQNVYEPAAIANKNFHMMGVTVYCDEFPATHRTVSKAASSDLNRDSFQAAPDTLLVGIVFSTLWIWYVNAVPCY